MIILKADISLSKVYRKMIETSKVPVDWTGLFIINNNMVLLAGETCSLIMDIDKRNVFVKSGRLNIDKENALETTDNKMLINIINMLLYIFGKWGAISGLKVKQDYQGLSLLISNILKDISVEGYYNSAGLKFLKKGIQITFEEVVIQAQERIEDIGEDETIGLWHNLVWKAVRENFLKEEIDENEANQARIGNNFYMVPYMCPKCGTHLHMIVFPEGKEYLIDTDDGKVYLARAYSCPECNRFFTPRPDKLLKEGEVYCLEFEDDEGAAGDYRVLLGEHGAKTANCNFNMYEADYRSGIHNKRRSLTDICRHLELLTDEEIQEILSKMDEGFFSERDRERFLALLEQELLYRQKRYEYMEGEFGKKTSDREDEYTGDATGQDVEAENDVIEKSYRENVETVNDVKGIDNSGDINNVKSIVNLNNINNVQDIKKDSIETQKTDKNNSEHIHKSLKERLHKDIKKDKRKKDNGENGIKEKKPDTPTKKVGSANEVNNGEHVLKSVHSNKSTEMADGDTIINYHDSEEKEAIDFTKKNTIKNSKDRKDDVKEGTKESKKFIKEKLNNEKERYQNEEKRLQNKSDDKLNISEEKDDYQENSSVKTDGEKYIDNEKVRKELESLVMCTPDNISRDRYRHIKEKLRQYKGIDIKPYEEYIDRKRDKVEKSMIDSVMTGINGMDKDTLNKTIERFKSMELEERNLSPVLEDIKKRIRQLDEEAILDICPNVLAIGFDDGVKALEEIRLGDFLPDIKSDMIARIEKRLRKIKSDECVQLVHKLKKECDGKILNFNRIHFYNIEKMNSGDNKDAESSLIRMAVSTYAVMIGEYEYPILICDSSVFESGKEGFIVTPDHIFYKGLLKSGSIDINNINGVEYGSKKGKGLYVKHNNMGLVKIPCTLNGTEMKGMADVLDSFIEYLKAKPQSRSVEYLSQGSHAVKCCYRCGHVFSEGNICPKCGSRNN